MEETKDFLRKTGYRASNKKLFGGYFRALEYMLQGAQTLKAAKPRNRLKFLMLLEDKGAAFGWNLTRGAAPKYSNISSSLDKKILSTHLNSLTILGLLPVQKASFQWCRDVRSLIDPLQIILNIHVWWHLMPRVETWKSIFQFYEGCILKTSRKSWFYPWFAGRDTIPHAET